MIKELAEVYTQTGEEREMRELLTEQLLKLIKQSERGEIGMSQYEETLRDIASQAGYFMRLLK